MTLVATALLATSGLLAVLSIQRDVRAVVTPTKPPSTGQRILRAGYIRAKSCAKLALGLALLPLVAGAAAALATTHDSSVQLRPQKTAPISAAVVAALAVIGDVVVIAAQPPGPPIDPDHDVTWHLLAAKEEIEAGDLHDGCQLLEEALQREYWSSYPIDTAHLKRACADGLLELALQERDARSRESALRRLEPSVLLGPAHRERIRQELTSIEERDAAERREREEQRLRNDPHVARQRALGLR